MIVLSECNKCILGWMKLQVGRVMLILHKNLLSYSLVLLTNRFVPHILLLG